MPEKKIIQLHPLNEEGQVDETVNLYPKTLKTAIVDSQGNRVIIQEKLTAGANITIDQTTNTISATGGSGSPVWGNITGTLSNQTDLVDELDKKQDKQGFSSLKRLGQYTYEVTFDSIPDYVEGNDGFSGSCTSFVRGGKLYRNLDWSYDNTAEFRVICKNFEGIAFTPGLNDGELDYNKVGQLPYHVNDGRNNSGIMVSTHVLYNDFSYEGSGDKDRNLAILPYYILTHITNINQVSTALTDYLANIKVPEYLIANEYLLQILITDGTTSWLVSPSDSGYELVNITANPKVTNFKWINEATLTRSDSRLQDRPTGIERWNLINENVTLQQLRFTLAYESPNRLSEFIGVNETTKDSTDEELTAIYNTAHAIYINPNRERDGQLWQTCHSVVYGSSGMEHLYTQENYNIDYVKAKNDKYYKHTILVDYEDNGEFYYLMSFVNANPNAMDIEEISQMYEDVFYDSKPVFKAVTKSNYPIMEEAYVTFNGTTISVGLTEINIDTGERSAGSYDDVELQDVVTEL